MEIINLFCDASIDTNLNIACAGCFIVYQDINGPNPIGIKKLIQKNATNNSSEILAIWIGITEALKLRQVHPNAVFRLFSDSKISLYGLRDWMKNWIGFSQDAGSNELISTSGKPVANQQRFIDIFNLIVENNLKIEFYHQRGHVGEGRVSMEKARVSFIKANKVSPEATGLGIEYLSECNRVVDNSTRDSLYRFIRNGILDCDTGIMLDDPLYYQIRASRLPQYINCINKSSVQSRHDFKGGYNQ